MPTEVIISMTEYQELQDYRKAVCENGVIVINPHLHDRWAYFMNPDNANKQLIADNKEANDEIQRLKNRTLIQRILNK